MCALEEVCPVLLLSIVTQLGRVVLQRCTGLGLAWWLTSGRRYGKGEFKGATARSLMRTEA